MNMAYMCVMCACVCVCGMRVGVVMCCMCMNASLQVRQSMWKLEDILGYHPPSLFCFVETWSVPGLR